jgi:hypothetical protein
MHLVTSEISLLGKTNPQENTPPGAFLQRFDENVPQLWTKKIK